MGGLEVQDHPWLHSKPEASLDNMKSCLKNTEQQQQRTHIQHAYMHV